MAQLQFFFAMDEKSVNLAFAKVKKVAEDQSCTIDEKPQKEETGCYKFTVYSTKQKLKGLHLELIRQGLPSGNLIE